LQAYAEFDMAAHEEEKTAGLFKKEIIGEHPAFMAKHTREGTQAKYEGAIEQAKFDANQQSLVANQQVRVAEAAVIDAAQRLRILGVNVDIDALLANASEASVDKLADEDVVAYPILAPFGATVIAKMAVMSQKADTNDVLFSLADLSTVWVDADIPESDFGLIPRVQTGTIRVTATAYPGRKFTARLLSVGATVDPATRTVPILAATDNSDGALILGMFARITLDSGTVERVLTVPASAVIEIEGKPAVFVPDAKDAHTFHFHPVVLGREAGDRRVVLSGLSAGDVVVSKGAFILKSELILQSETEEE
jgi:RND family efflux transporter MFP subunit